MRSEKPLVSIVSLTYNRKEKVTNLLCSLQEQTYEPFEIILVENASSDGTAELVRDHFPGVRLLSMPRNLGMVAYNYGFKEAGGEYIVVIDDDGLPVDENWVAQTVARFEANPQLGVVCCAINMLDTGKVARDNPQFLPVGDPATGYSAAAYNGTGAGIRAKVLHKVGYYPDYFFRSWLELHLCTRILDAGWDVRYYPMIQVWHDRPSGSIGRPQTYYGIRNYYWYVWSLCPGPYYLLKETLRYTGSLLKRVAGGQIEMSVVARAIRDAISSSGNTWKERRSVSASTWRSLYRIRMPDKVGQLITQFGEGVG